jgi:hypothetical protein
VTEAPGANDAAPPDILAVPPASVAALPTREVNQVADDE